MFETGRWVCLVESRAPHFTDMLWDAGYVRSPAGYFRVPFNQVWGLVAQAGLGVNGYGYTIYHVTPVYHNG